MKIGVCGVACEKCPRMIKGACPNKETGCVPKDNPKCRIATCAYHGGLNCASNALRSRATIRREAR